MNRGLDRAEHNLHSCRGIEVFYPVVEEALFGVGGADCDLALRCESHLIRTDFRAEIGRDGDARLFVVQIFVPLFLLLPSPKGEFGRWVETRSHVLFGKLTFHCLPSP